MVDGTRLLLCLLTLAMLTACQSLPQRSIAADPPPPLPTPVPAAAPAPVAAPKPPRSLAIVPDPEPEPEPSLWEQMRAGFSLPGCDYAPRTEHWIRRYAASPRRFAAVLDELLPALEYTHRQVQAAQLPSELALLPIVESHFRPHVAGFDRPAGIWQIVGGTGRSVDLRMDAWIDGRLNLAASTDAAIALLDRYGDYFDNDWRLATFAYNAGEFRVRKALERHQPGDSFDSLRGLGLAEGTYEYLTKLLALSCLVREPERFDLDLPTLEPERRLERIELDGVVGSNLARALSGMSHDEFARFNAGLRRDRTPPNENFALLVRAPAADQVPDVLAAVPPNRRIGWHQRALNGSESLYDIAVEHGLETTALLALNGLPANADEAPAHGTFWLPGRATSSPDAVANLAGTDGTYIVRSGDSLWAIARRHSLTVADLLRYNGLSHSRLRPGQRLRLSAP